MKGLRISVCVATYNQQDHIEVCLRSILDQDVDAELEVLVGNDASTDATGDIIDRLEEEYGSKLVHVRRRDNLGPFENMRELLGRARGELIARVDGDDFWLPGKLARQLQFLSRHPDCDAVYTNAIVVDVSGRRLGLFNDVGTRRLDLSDLLRRGNVLNNSSVLFRRANLSGWTREIEQLDFQVHLWQAERTWLGHIGEPLSAYRVDVPGSMVTAMSERVRELYWDALCSLPRTAVSQSDLARGMADFLRRVFFRSLRGRDAGLFMRWLRRVCLASPYGAGRTCLLFLHSVIRVSSKVLFSRLLWRRKQSVLYPH